ncbi:MAG: hypothetical protein LQ341_004380 [Variospora aurantia]|nr:MAG: hypothetical protein LQ341_004380 [Variospora aurantia]
MSTFDEPPVPPPVPPPKTEEADEDSFSDSSHDFDGPEEYVQEAAQVQKRKGGRKPVGIFCSQIYATSEERKQRNRQAQAAFRERRTEYIKQLETTIKQHEDSLQTLQQSHRHAADECLMLRYKNSLLERILLEKGASFSFERVTPQLANDKQGIDVQAELRSKTDPQHVTPSLQAPAGAHPSPVHRAVNNRHTRTRRAGSAGGAGGPKSQSSQTSMISDQSIRTHPTPPMATSSPVKAKSSMSSLTSGFSGAIYHAPHQAPPPSVKHRRTSKGPPSSMHSPTAGGHLSGPPHKSNGTSKGAEMGTAAASLPAYYAPTFRSHIEQLEQEYDAPADMLDEDPSDHSAGPGPYTESFYQHPVHPSQKMGMGMQAQSPLAMQPPSTSQVMDAHGMFLGSMGQPWDPFNPMLDADPFGLDRSMHFPTQFTS